MAGFLVLGKAKQSWDLHPNSSLCTNLQLPRGTQDVQRMPPHLHQRTQVSVTRTEGAALLLLPLEHPQASHAGKPAPRALRRATRHRPKPAATRRRRRHPPRHLRRSPRLGCESHRPAPRPHPDLRPAGCLPEPPQPYRDSRQRSRNEAIAQTVLEAHEHEDGTLIGPPKVSPDPEEIEEQRRPPSLGEILLREAEALKAEREAEEDARKKRQDEKPWEKPQPGIVDLKATTEPLIKRCHPERSAKCAVEGPAPKVCLLPCVSKARF